MPRRRLKLPIPAGPKYPRAFYERLADIYSRLVKDGEKHPAKVIADANGFSVKTVHRWIALARLMNLLPEGRQGKAG